MGTKRLWETFPDLVEAVRRDYIEQGSVGGGHDFLHTLMVAQYGQMIAENERVGVLAWVAGICHNTDRIFPDANGDEIIRIVMKYIVGHTKLSRNDRHLIAEAVLEHGKPNNPNDNPVTVTLKDADRLANLGALECIRAGQFRPNIPAVDPIHFLNDPDATYRDPRSVIRDIYYVFEWKSWLRLPRAKELAKPYFDFLEKFLQLAEAQLRETGLYPYPEELA